MFSIDLYCISVIEKTIVQVHIWFVSVRRTLYTTILLYNTFVFILLRVIVVKKNNFNNCLMYAVYCDTLKL